jgi:AraC family transcriptional regulator, transcriptional activator of pobA
MKKQMDLRTFSVYQYLKEQYAHRLDLPYFLADQDTYKNASISFPFRTFTYGIGFTYSGDGDQFRIGSREYTVQPGNLCTIGPGIVAQWNGAYTAVHDTLYFTEELFSNTLKASFLKSLPFFLPGGNHVIPVSAEQIEKMKALFQTLKQFKDDPAIVPGIVYSLLMLAVQCHKVRARMKSPLLTAKEEITTDFRTLLSKHFAEHKDVAFYAAQLNITSKYLSEVLMQETGKSAKVLIEEHVFMEAKSLLRQTNMTVQEICHWLGYADTSYFTKAFKKQEGMTPLDYRRL